MSRVDERKRERRGEKEQELGHRREWHVGNFYREQKQKKKNKKRRGKKEKKIGQQREQPKQKMAKQNDTKQK